MKKAIEIIIMTISHIKNILGRLVLIYLVPCVIICSVTLSYVSQNTQVRIIGDEFGYWTAAAWINHWDWTTVASYNGYFSWGYGVVLSLLARFITNMSRSYQLALVLNSVFLCLTYILIFKVSGYFCSQKQVLLRVILSLATIMYGGNLFYSQFTMAETPLLLLFWLSVFLLCKVCTKYSRLIAAVYCLTLVYMYYVHMRTLGILIVGLLFLFYHLLIHLRNRQEALLCSIVAILALLLGHYVKYNYKLYLQSNPEAPFFAVADYEGLSEHLVKPSEIVTAVPIGFVGKLYYLIVSSLGLGMIAISSIYDQIIKADKQKMDNKNYVILYVLCSILITIFITCIFQSNYDTRYDLLVYGRYYDFIISSFVLIGFAGLINNKKFHLKTSLLVLLLASLITNYFIPKSIGHGPIHFNSPGLQYVLELVNYNLFIAGCICAGLLVIIYFAFYLPIKTEKLVVVFAVLFAIYQITSYKWDYERKVLTPGSIESMNKEIELADYIKSHVENRNIYFYRPEDNTKSMEHLQFQLGNVALNCTSDVNRLRGLSADDYLVTPQNYNLNEEIGEILPFEYESICESKRNSLWQPIATDSAHKQE